MKNQNFVSCFQNTLKTTNRTFLRLYMFTLITLLTHFCEGEVSIGQIINTNMFEIPSENQTSYLLKDCRKLAGDDIDCKCTYLGRECNKTDVENCRSCSCLDGSTRIFHVKKRYGAVCLSVNNIFNAAGFSEKFLIHNPSYNRCAQVDKLIRHTEHCNFSDPRQEWIWTPGNLLMNVQTLTCLLATKTGSPDFLNMIVTQCNSLSLGQKWRCNDSRLLWGTSLDSPNILTNAVRYYYKDDYLKARNVTLRWTTGNSWAVFPSNNRSVCSASHNEGSFFFGEENTKISQIDLVLPCPNGVCSKKLLSSTSSDNLSNCTILWDAKFPPNVEPFFVDNEDDGIYFMWRSNSYTRLAGETLDLTVECVRNNRKFEEYLFRLRVKHVIFKTLPEQYRIIQTNDGENSSIPIVDLNKNCSRNRCFRELIVASTLNKTTAICDILWNESTFSKLDTTSSATENTTELLSLTKHEKTFNLEWNLSDARSLANIRFNLTILCYNDESENTTFEKSSLVFQTKPFIDESTTERSCRDKTCLYLVITFPVIIVVLLVIVLIFRLLRRRKKRIKESTSKQNLHSNVERQFSNSSLNIDSSGVECKSEDNPVYEQCTATAHPTVTIARNQLYEYTTNVKARADSDIYEKPIEGVKERQNKLYVSVDPSKNKPHPATRSSPKPSPKVAPKPARIPQPAKKPPTPPRYKAPKIMQPSEDSENDVYDQPLGFIPSLQKNQEGNKLRDEIPLEDLEKPRIHSTYDKPLPDSPPSSGIYDYATREDLTTLATQCEAEKPLEFTKWKVNNGSVNSNGSTYDAPHYDVLERH